MSSSSAHNLFSLARSKLDLSASDSGRDTHSLHRWVLLKNSIHSSSKPTVVPNTPPPSPVDSPNPPSHDDDTTETDFMFPDSGQLARASEAAWLDSMLQSLAEDEDDDYVLDSNGASCSEEDLHLLSPLSSPMSSSDDLPSQIESSIFQSHSYTPAYPSYRTSAPLPWDFHEDSDPLPYCVLDDDIEDPDVCPEAIEDTSDDESEVPATPSLGNSGHQETGDAESYPTDPAAIPLPPDRSGLRHVVTSKPHVYYNSDLGFGFHQFEFASLPFSQAFTTHFSPIADG